MELKNLLNKINQQTEEQKRFLAIEVSAEVVKTAVWQVEDKKTEVVSVGTVEEWKGESPEDLVVAIDASLVKALGEVDPEPDEVIFGLPETWVGDEGIADSKKPFLKEITSKLDLKPVGFVVTTEAVVHYLQAIEGGPPSTLLLYLTETEVAITLVNLGKIIGTQAVGRSEDLGKDVEEGLARFSDEEQLPARMLLYDGNIDLESAKQILISYDWQEKLPFLHFPKVESLEIDATIRSIAVAGGAEVAKSLGLEVNSIELQEEITEKVVEEPEVEEVVGESKEELVTKKEEIPDMAQEFGFTTAKKIDGGETLEQPPDPGVGETTPESIKAKKNEVFTLADHQVKIRDGSEDTQEEELVAEEKQSLRQRMGMAFAGVGSIVKKITLPKFSKGPFRNIPPMVLIGAGLIILLFVVGFLAYWNIPKAKVAVYLSPQSIEKEVQFVLDETETILDADNRIVPTKKESTMVSGTKEAATTGENLIGERATGRVRIYNRTQSSKTFEAGSTIQVDSYSFSLDEGVTIASASTQENADFSTTIVPSTAEVSVTADDIGDDYNFASGTQLTVENFAESSFVATAISDFAGGFSREIQAVSEEDRDNLLEALTDELRSKALEQVGAESDQQKGVVQIDEVLIQTEEFTAEIDDEVETLGLKLEIELPIYTYQVADLRLLLERQYENEIPDNFMLSDENIEVSVVEASVNDDGTVDVEARVTIKLLPKLNEEEIADNIRGKYPELTQDYFSSLPNFSRVETEFSVFLPARLNTFPRKASNIEVEIKVEE